VKAALEFWKALTGNFETLGLNLNTPVGNLEAFGAFCEGPAAKFDPTFANV
jgi:hypothetical protein